MKMITCILAFVLATCHIMSQDNRDYFPMIPKSVWVYKQQSNPNVNVVKCLRDSVRLIGDDTLIYMISSEKQSIFYVYNIARQNVEQREISQPDVGFLNFPLGLKPGEKTEEKFLDAYRVYQFYSEQDFVVFGTKRKVRCYRFYQRSGNIVTDATRRYLAKGIGLISSYSELSPDQGDYLAGCIINGDTLGDISTSVTSTDETVNLRSEDEIELFPQPASDVLYLRSISSSILSLQLFDETGRLLQKIDLNSGSNSARLDLSAIRTGFYVCRIETANKILNRRILVVN